MSEEKKSGIVGETAQVVAGVIQTVPVYDDLVRPLAKQAGKALETVGKAVNAALLPLHVVVWGSEKLWEFIDSKVTPKLENVPPESIQTPAANVAVPAIEALRYTGEESELADLFASLLASAMDKQTAKGAHPAFAHIIKNLVPDEAKIMRRLIKTPQMPIVDVYLEVDPNRLIMVQPDQSDLHLIDCESPELIPVYLRNLERLGLVELPPAVLSYSDGSLYEPLEARLRSTLEIFLSPVSGAKIRRKQLNVTPFGLQMMHVCQR